MSTVPDPPPDRGSTEPAMKVAGYTSLGTIAAAVIVVLVSFGIGVSAQQGTAIVALVTALAGAPLVSGWLTRSRVYAPATVAAMLDDAKADAKADAATETAAMEAEPPGLHRWPESPLEP